MLILFLLILLYVYFTVTFFFNPMLLTLKYHLYNASHGDLEQN